MCGGGDDGGDSSSNDNQTSYENEAYGSGMSPGESTAKFGDASNAGTAPDISDYGNMSKDDYVSDVLSHKGYSDNYKGVSDSKGNAVTDGQGNPVRSGSYVDTLGNAENTYDAYQEYQAELAKAQETFYDDMEARQVIDQDLIDAAMNKGGYVAGFDSSYGHPLYGTDLSNPVGGKYFDPTNVSIMQGPPSMQDLQSYGNFLGSSTDMYAMPGYSFADPFGTAMAPTLGAIDDDPNTISRSERDYFDAFSSGYNKSQGFLGSNIETDAANNVGFSTAGQRFSDTAGGLVMGLVGSGLAGPLGSAIASGVNVNTMNQYGPQVPGFTPEVRTTTFSPGASIGSLLGSKAGAELGQRAAMNTYNATGGNINAAIGVGAGVGMAGGQLGESLGGMAQKGMGFNNMMSSDISSPYAGRLSELNEEDGVGATFGASVQGDGNDGGSVSAPSAADGIASLAEATQDMTAPPPDLSSLTTPSVVSTDFAQGDTPGIDSEGEFDSGEFIRTQAQLSNPNSQQASDLFGNFANDLMTNPLFSAAPAGVQYLSKGRQRDYGNAIYNVASKLQNYAGARRRGFGNRLTGIVI
jgi:hypothetical protein